MVSETQNTQDSKTSVFVVHGRNEALRRSFFDFLRAIGLRPIEWSQAIAMTRKASPFIGEVLDAAFVNAQAAVVLLTGDDEAKLQTRLLGKDEPAYEKELSPQARPNVLFESGLALGRYPDRTILVEVGKLRPFSDIAGRHTVRLDNSFAKRQDMALRLAACGCKIDITGTDWHSVGNFEEQIFGASISTNKPEIPTRKNVPQSKIEARGSTTEALEPDEVNVLLALGSFAVASWLLVEQIATKSKLSPQRTAYFLERLAGRGFVIPTSANGFLYYKLAADGRAFLVENNLLTVA